MTASSMYIYFLQLFVIQNILYHSNGCSGGSDQTTPGDDDGSGDDSGGEDGGGGEDTTNPKRGHNEEETSSGHREETSPEPVAPTNKPGLPEGGGWYPLDPTQNDTWIYLGRTEERMNFDDAKKHCKSTDNSTMLEIYTAEEFEKIKELIRKSFEQYKENKDKDPYKDTWYPDCEKWFGTHKPQVGDNNYCDIYWLGFTDIKKEGNWIWNSGRAVTFKAWASNQPDNRDKHGKVENCGGIAKKHLQGGKQYGWNDFPCDGIFQTETANAGGGKVDCCFPACRLDIGEKYEPTHSDWSTIKK